MSNSTNPTSGAKEEKGYYEPYTHFAKTLRTWFIAYGIGVPAVLLTSNNALGLVVASGNARGVAILFLVGVCLQVGLAMLYKFAMWQLYSAELDSDHTKTLCYSVGAWISDRYWLELSADLATLALFAWATYDILIAVTTAS
jgi:hypothetical protein